MANSFEELLAKQQASRPYKATGAGLMNLAEIMRGKSPTQTADKDDTFARDFMLKQMVAEQASQKKAQEADLKFQRDIFLKNLTTPAGEAKTAKTGRETKAQRGIEITGGAPLTQPEATRTAQITPATFSQVGGRDVSLSDVRPSEGRSEAIRFAGMSQAEKELENISRFQEIMSGKKETPKQQAKKQLLIRDLQDMIEAGVDAVGNKVTLEGLQETALQDGILPTDPEIAQILESFTPTEESELNIIQKLLRGLGTGRGTSSNPLQDIIESSIQGTTRG